MRKFFWVLALIFSFLSILLVAIYAQDVPELPAEINPDKLEETTAKVSEKWQYLGENWKSEFLKNSIVKSVDSFFQKISMVFFVLFSRNYSLSLVLSLIIFFWLYILYNFNTILKDFSSFSKPISFFISLIFVVIISHLKLFEKLAIFLIELIFGERPLWLNILFLMIILGLLILVGVFLKKFGTQIRADRLKMREFENRIKLDAAAKAGESFTKALSDVSD